MSARNMDGLLPGAGEEYRCSVCHGPSGIIHSGTVPEWVLCEACEERNCEKGDNE
jgi:hypothetical protein